MVELTLEFGSLVEATREPREAEDSVKGGFSENRVRCTWQGLILYISKRGTNSTCVC